MLELLMLLVLLLMELLVLLMLLVLLLMGLLLETFVYGVWIMEYVKAQGAMDYDKWNERTGRSYRGQKFSLQMSDGAALTRRQNCCAYSSLL